MREHRTFSITTACCLMLTTLPDYQTTALDNPFTVGPKAVSQAVVKKSFPKKLPPKRATSSIYDTNQVEKQILYRQNLQKRKQHDTILLQEAKRKEAKSEQPSIASTESDQTLLQYTSTRSLASRSGPGLLANTASTEPASATRSRLVAIAMKFVGSPYKWSGNTPDGFDCSGFVQYVFQQAGIPLPRTSFDQYRIGTAITIQDLKPGDLVFFSTYASGPSHVGIYTGSGTFIQCLNSSTGVVLSRMDDPYYLSCFVGARRIA